MDKSLAEIMLKFGARADMRTIAYSRVSDVGVRFIVDHVLQGFSNPKILGAAGMHEHFGGIIQAVYAGSWPEDTRGGASNVIVWYPKSEDEARLFREIKEQRAHNTPEPRCVAGSEGRALWVFDDVDSGL